MFIESQRPSQSKETATARPARPARPARLARPARHQSVDFGDACAFNEFHGCFRMVLGCHKERSMTVIVCDSYIRYYYNYNVSYCHCLCQFFHSDPSNCSYRFIVDFQFSCKPCIHSESLKFWRNSLRRPAISYVYCMLKATLAFHCFEMIRTRNQKDSAWGWLWVAFEHLSNHAMLVEGNGVPCTMVPSSLEVKWIVDPGWPIQ